MTSIDVIRQAAPRTLRQCMACIASGLVGLTLVTPAFAFDQAQHLPTITLGASFHNIKAEVAQTPEQHEIGLMYRTSMGANEGMLFIFNQAGQQCFWMKNTLIPLAVAFIDNEGTIINIDEMKPKTLNPHCSTKPARFVLEMNAAWFTKRGIKAGEKITGEPFGTTH